MTLRDQIHAATDELNTLRCAYYQQQAEYDACKAAAVKLLELRQQAEKQFMGKVKTKITTQAIASLLRSS